MSSMSMFSLIDNNAIYIPDSNSCAKKYYYRSVCMGTVTMIFTGFIYYLFPFITGRMYKEKPAQIQFIMAMIDISLVFGTQHMLGLYEQPRLYLNS